MIYPKGIILMHIIKNVFLSYHIENSMLSSGQKKGSTRWLSS